MSREDVRVLAAEAYRREMADALTVKRSARRGTGVFMAFEMQMLRYLKLLWVDGSKHGKEKRSE